MTAAISCTVSGDSPAELADRLHALADALAPTASAPSRSPATNAPGGLPAVPSSPAPKLCAVHHAPLRFDEWESKSGKACKAWRCPQSTPGSDCSIEWAS